MQVIFWLSSKLYFLRKLYFGLRQSYISAFSRSCVAHCAFEITLLQAILLTLLLVCAFSPRKYKSILRGFYNKDSLSGRLPRVINCAFDQSFHAKSENACLLLVYSFSPRVHSIPRGPLIFARNDVKRVARNKKPTKKHPFGCLNIKSPQNGENLIKLYLP